MNIDKNKKEIIDDIYAIRHIINGDKKTIKVDMSEEEFRKLLEDDEEHDFVLENDTLKLVKKLPNNQ